MREIIFLTGVTGSLGSALLGELLVKKANADIYCLVRSDGGESPQIRLNRVIEDMDIAVTNSKEHEFSRRIFCIPGDIEQERLGMSTSDWSFLTSNVSCILHLAANVDFNLTIDESRRRNVESTRQTLEFAVQCCQKTLRFHYVSTAYVIGKRTGALLETDCGSDAHGYWNAYEQSKAEAEMLVHTYYERLKMVIYRPSQVVGSSQTGRIGKYFGFYEFVELATKGKAKVLVADPDAKPDLIPSDYICQAIVALMDRDDSIGKTYNLVAGLKNSLPIHQIVDQVSVIINENNLTGKKFVKPAIIPAHLLESRLSPEELLSFNCSPQKLLLRSYQSYLSYSRDFDAQATHKLLESLGVTVPNMSEVIGRTTSYALAKRRATRQYRQFSHQL